MTLEPHTLDIRPRAPPAAAVARQAPAELPRAPVMVPRARVVKPRAPVMMPRAPVGEALAELPQAPAGEALGAVSATRRLPARACRSSTSPSRRAPSRGATQKRPVRTSRRQSAADPPSSRLPPTCLSSVRWPGRHYD